MLGKPPDQPLTFAGECSTQGKIFFYAIAQYLCKTTFFSKLVAFIGKSEFVVGKKKQQQKKKKQKNKKNPRKR